ncbi:hypothetical protein GWL_42030 [Herbaspirillum sp. GW103]|nr:hypothetical protein GWL_42030 [Herbaspirillum sp. GW103]
MKNSLRLIAFSTFTIWLIFSGNISPQLGLHIMNTAQANGPTPAS